MTEVPRHSIRYRDRMGVAEVQDMLSPAECQTLTMLGVTDVGMREAGMYNHTDGTTLYGDARQSKIAWLRMPQDPAIQSIFDTVEEINETFFKFRLDRDDNMGLQFTTYEPGGHYTWHRDWNVSELANRKLSVVIQLSSPNQYGGGGLEIYTGHDGSAYEAPRQQGAMLVFPSFMMHRVVPVDWGTRYSLVLWATGPNLS